MADDRAMTQDGRAVPPLVGGRYEVWRRLGAGGMGEVWEAWDHKLERRVAMKCPPRELWPILEARERIKREARTQGRLEHPNIVSVQDIQDEGLGRPVWLVMQFVEGRTLSQVLLDQGRLPLAQAAALAVQVGRALEHAHERGIVHRDIKPANIVVDASGWAWVLDFGIARVMRHTVATYTGGAGSSGTPLYMAPEQRAGGPAARDRRVDIYALGAVLYEMLVGESPFADAEDVNYAKEHFRLDPSSLADVPGAVADLIGRCLSADPDARPGAMAEVVEALERAAGDLRLPRGPAARSEERRPEQRVEPTSIRAEAATVASDADLSLIRLKGSGLAEDFLVRQRSSEITPDLVSDFLIHTAARGYQAVSAEEVRRVLEDALVRVRGRWEKAAWEALSAGARALESGDIPGARRIVEGAVVPAGLADLGRALERLRARIGAACAAALDRFRGGDEQKRFAAEAGIPVAKELDLGGGVTLKLVLMPPGEFMMGSREGESGRDGDEGPQHRVRITKPFYMGIHEVTQAQYQAVMGRNPSEFSGQNNPVEMVSWNDATEFCKKLSQMAGAEVRLPTEAEWEHACRAGTTTRFWSGDHDGDLDEVAWYEGNSGSKTHPVGGKKPNAWGLYDMHGNMWEWCQDWYDGDYYAKSPKDDPKGPQSGERRVLRGGSWDRNPRNCRSANRGGFEPTDVDNAVGFRVAVSRDSK